MGMRPVIAVMVEVYIALPDALPPQDSPPHFVEEGRRVGTQVRLPQPLSVRPPTGAILPAPDIKLRTSSGSSASSKYSWLVSVHE